MAAIKFGWKYRAVILVGLIWFGGQAFGDMIAPAVVPLVETAVGHR